MRFLSRTLSEKRKAASETADIDSLKAAAEYLKSQPQVACDPYPNYDNRIFDVLGSLPPDYEYLDHYGDLENKAIGDMTLDDLATMYTFIIRGERFCDGHIASFVEDGRLLKLVNRQIELLE